MSDQDSDENGSNRESFHHQRRRAVVKRKKTFVEEEEEEEVIQPQFPGLDSTTRLSEQFNQAASQNEDIKYAYEECWKFENSKIGNSDFSSNMIKGVLRKKVDGFKLDNFPSRFYIMDFQRAVIVIKYDRFDKDSDPNIKVINFRDIDDCYLPKEKHEDDMRANAHEDFPNPFLLKTKERIFELYASLKQEREMWMNAFKYVCKSTKVVQSLIHQNDSSQKQKSEEQQRQIHENAIQRANSYQVRNVEGTRAPLNFTNTIQRDNDIKFEAEKVEKLSVLENELKQQKEQLELMQNQQEQLDTNKKNQEGQKNLIKSQLDKIQKEKEDLRLHQQKLAQEKELMRIQQEQIAKEKEELRLLNEQLAQSEKEKIQMKIKLQKEQEEIRLQKEQIELEIHLANEKAKKEALIEQQKKEENKAQEQVPAELHKSPSKLKIKKLQSFSKNRNQSGTREEQKTNIDSLKVSLNKIKVQKPPVSPNQASKIPRIIPKPPKDDEEKTGKKLKIKIKKQVTEVTKFESEKNNEAEQQEQSDNKDASLKKPKQNIQGISNTFFYNEGKQYLDAQENQQQNTGNNNFGQIIQIDDLIVEDY